MNEQLTPERIERRESMKGKSRYTLVSDLKREVLEDLVAATPNVQLLNIALFDDTTFNISDLSELKDLLGLKLLEGPELTSISLEGIQEFNQLTGLEINVNSAGIDEIDLTPLLNHPELAVITISCPAKNLKGLDAFNTIPNLQSIGLYSLDIHEIDLTSLTSCKKLESIYMGDLGQENPTVPYKISLPKNSSLKIVEISECYSEELRVELDFSFLEGLESLDSLALVNCNLTNFDFNQISSLKRIGKIDLTNNKITHLDVTPIIAKPMFTERALGEPSFSIDEEVVIQIAKSKEKEVIALIGKPDEIVEDHKGSFAIEYEFGHKWLKNVIDSHDVEWIL